MPCDAVAPILCGYSCSGVRRWSHSVGRVFVLFLAIAKQGCTVITAWCLGRCVDHCRSSWDSPIVARSIINHESERQTVRIPLSAAAPSHSTPPPPAPTPVKCSTYAGKQQESTAATAVYVSLIGCLKSQQPTNWLVRKNSPFNFNSLKGLA